MEVIILALVAAAPFLLWPVEILFPYPHFLEEVLKLVLILLILKISESATKKIILAASAGALFAFSESILFFLLIFQIGQPGLFFQRLAFTIPLHVLTLLLMLLPGLKKKELTFVGFLLAVILHYGYNLLIGGIFNGLTR